MNLKEEIIKLKKKCYECKECPLGRREVDGLDPHVYSSGFVKSKIMFIAEAPGKQETIERKPLVGRSGKFFETKILEQAGLNRNQVFITNSVMCRPNGNRTPFPTEIEICRTHLDAQICLLNPSLIITMGNVALDTCCNTRGIVKQRGKLRWSREWSNGKRIAVYPMFHPSYCLRGSGLKETAEDAVNIKKLYVVINNNEALEI